VKAAFGYVPSACRIYLASSVRRWPATTCPLPFFSDSNAPLWHAAIGYEYPAFLASSPSALSFYLIARLLGRAARSNPRPQGATP